MCCMNGNTSILMSPLSISRPRFAHNFTTPTSITDGNHKIPEKSKGWQ